MRASRVVISNCAALVLLFAGDSRADANLLSYFNAPQSGQVTAGTTHFNLSYWTQDSGGVMVEWFVPNGSFVSVDTFVTYVTAGGVHTNGWDATNYDAMPADTDSLVLRYRHPNMTIFAYTDHQPGTWSLVGPTVTRSMTVGPQVPLMSPPVLAVTGLLLIGAVMVIRRKLGTRS